jgi:hypothetical protein
VLAAAGRRISRITIETLASVDSADADLARERLRHARCSRWRVIGYVLQDWTTVHATNATSGFTQTDCGWLELVGFRDLTAWIHVAAATVDASVTVNLETSPTRDENLFQTLTTTSVGAGGAVYVAISRARFASVPLARVLRWKVAKSNASSDWSIAFRVLVALNPVVADFQIIRDGELFSNPVLSGL